MAGAPIPTVVAMLVCDQIIAELGTNKKSLIGVFDNLFSLRFPTHVPRLALYIKFADGAGQYTFKIRVVNLKDESLIAAVAMPATLPDINQYAELAFNILNFSVPEPGKYEFQLYAEEVYLHRVTMEAKLAELPPGGLSWLQPK